MAQSAEEKLAEAMVDCYADPLWFVEIAYPWGEKGSPLEHYAGPDKWQREYLTQLGEEVKRRNFDRKNAVAPIRMARASGHGVGKSTLSAWLVDWIMSTRPHCKGTVTANTFQQLESKTWAAIRQWTNLCITSHWFSIRSDRMEAKAHPATWGVDAATCREENSESFAGQHAVTSTSFYLFDEASAVPDRIWEVAEGGLTDGEPHFYAFGNPTRSSGKFHRVCFGSDRNRWNHGSIDSRDAAVSNKELIAEWVADHGEDSDFVRVRVRGLPPRASDVQFIDSDRVVASQHRDPVFLDSDPLIAALDMARGGADNCVFRFRRGNDARTYPPIRIPGEQSRDSMRIVSLAGEVLTGNRTGGVKPSVLFVDETGGSVGGPVGDRLRQLGHANVIGVQFGGASPDPHYGNMRAFMWAKLRDWLERGAIDKDQVLEQDLIGPGYYHDKQDRIFLEAKEQMKKRGLASPR